MARNQQTPDEFEAISAELMKAAKSLSSVAATMREHGMPHALVHGTMPQTMHIPAIIDWVGKINVDVNSQLRAFLSGVQSRAEFHKQKSENQKSASASKKSWPKKATKKKAT